MKTRCLWSQYVALLRWDPGAPLSALMPLSAYLALCRRLRRVRAELWARTTPLRGACAGHCVMQVARFLFGDR